MFVCLFKCLCLTSFLWPFVPLFLYFHLDFLSRSCLDLTKTSRQMVCIWKICHDPLNHFFCYFLFACNMIKSIYICLHMLHIYIYIYTVQQRVARSLAVSVTYQEWLGHLCGLLLLAAHRTKAMRSQDPCTAVAPLSLPFCSGNNERWLAAETWINGLTFTCVNDSKKHMESFNVAKKELLFCDSRSWRRMYQGSWWAQI